MTIPGGIRVKLSLALLVIVGSALLAAYAIIVPSLERRLVEAKLDQQQSDAEILAIRLRDPGRRRTTSSLGDFVDAPDSSRTRGSSSSASAARRRSGRCCRSPTRPRSAAPRWSATRRRSSAATTVSTVRARVRHDGREYAEVAVPLLTGGDVMLLSSSLSDQLATVALVKRRLLYATVAALLISVVLGFAVAALHARRLGRLQRAADRIAEGAFDEPVIDNDLDEVGQLAASFDRMRLQLAQLDRARKEFVANASHELRTPLFSIAGFLELLDDEDLDESTRMEFLATTRSQVDRLTNLATDLLDLSRMDAGRIRIEDEEVGLAEIARQVAEDFFALADASGHTPPARRRRGCLGARGRGADPADRAGPDGQRARAHAGGDDGAAPGRAARQPRRPGGRGQRPRHPGRASRARLPAVLPGRGRPGVRERARARDRPRARGPDGRHGHRDEQARRDGLHARVAGRRRGSPPARARCRPEATVST